MKPILSVGQAVGQADANDFIADFRCSFAEYEGHIGWGKRLSLGCNDTLFAL